MYLHLPIVVYGLLKIVGSTSTQFETQSDVMIKPEWYYTEVGSRSPIHCAVICGWDKLCMSASHGENNGYLEAWNMIGKTYYLFDYGWRTYEQAIAFCEQEGGKLAEPYANSSNQLIQNYIAELDGSNYFWFGLNDIPTEGQFTWASTGDLPSYSGWKTGEPSSGLADCCAYDPSGNWNAFACHNLACSICELA